MAVKRSIYLRMPMTREDAEQRLASLRADADLIFKAAIDPTQSAQSMTISAGGGSKSITFKSEAARQSQLALVQTAIDDLKSRFTGKSPAGTGIIRRGVRIV